MQKTRLGISVGLLGAAVFFACFFGGYTVAILLGGYILLFEENAWLKRSAVKAIALMFGFAVLSAVVYLIPNLISFIDDVCRVFEGSFYLPVVTNIITVITSALTILEKVLFIVLGIKAFNQGTVKIPVIDSLLNKYMN